MAGEASGGLVSGRPAAGTDSAVECRCAKMNELQGAEVETYVAGHLRWDGGAFVCPDTGKRWRLDESDREQPRLVGEPR